jgi:hypothetical protein
MPAEKQESMTMKRMAVLSMALAGLVLAGGCASLCPCGADKSGATEPVVRHVVLFKFKDTATPEQVKAVEDAFRALPAKIPEIAGYEWGTNVSPEGLAQGFTHCFFLTFKDAKARDAYLPHPDHKAFGKVLGPVLDKVLVVDYVAQR